ncbi:uncharacterized protein [Antedon mediterranea]|uniref:uncharacterized protein n=1 Tax=Antedon mediterranea TaxID=105859 RepID=UPI003AF48881
MQWKDIAKCLHVSAKTLRRHRSHLGIPDDPYTTISDEDLDQNIVDILYLAPQSGETYVIGGLRGRRIFVPRARIRERLNIIDPVGRALRWRSTIVRRTYNVTVPNQLCVYQPRIQQSLDQFISMWNHHGLRTMNGQSPLALWLGDYLSTK